jgi:hypothetical protein
VSSHLLYDGFEFRDEETLKRYKRLKRTLSVTSLLSIAALLPALAMFFSGMISASTSYFYVIPLAVGGVFGVLSYRANSRLTELINSEEVRHVG